jgi:UPF0716 protein FxsA
MVKRILFAILLLPVAETAAFVLVAALIGVTGALLLMLATTLAGILVLRQAGRGGIARFRVAVADAQITATEMNGAGFLTVLAGLLLVLPGFLTDLVGAALLIAPVRRWFGRMFRTRFESWLSTGVARRNRKDTSVVDLAPDEWEQVPERELPDRSQRPRPR